MRLQIFIMKKFLSQVPWSYPEILARRHFTGVEKNVIIV